MKVKVILLFLSIFSTGCLENLEDNTSLSELPDSRGELVSESEFCQTLGVIEPDEIGKHLLSVSLKPFRDLCQSLILAPSPEFTESKEYYQCQWVGEKGDFAGPLWTQLISLVSQESAQTIFSSGDLNRYDLANGLESMEIILTTDSSTDAVIIGTQADLWPYLTFEPQGLQGLEWRLHYQSLNSTLCGEEARWGQADESWYVDNVEKCDLQGDQWSYDYTFDLSGRLSSLIENPPEQNIFCQPNQP